MQELEKRDAEYAIKRLSSDSNSSNRNKARLRARVPRDLIQVHSTVYERDINEDWIEAYENHLSWGCSSESMKHRVYKFVIASFLDEAGHDLKRSNWYDEVALDPPEDVPDWMYDSKHFEHEVANRRPVDVYYEDGDYRFIGEAGDTPYSRAASRYDLDEGPLVVLPYKGNNRWNDYNGEYELMIFSTREYDVETVLLNK